MSFIELPSPDDTVPLVSATGRRLELPYLPPCPGCVVTGTDTNVGKTWIAAGLVAVLRRWGHRAVYFKPVQSGCPEENGRPVPTDARFARDLAALEEPLDLLTPIALRLPLAPGVAAAREGVAVDLRKIAAAFGELAQKYEFIVVEGAGGLYVPLQGHHFLVLDLVRWLRLPLVVVARPGLGTINHTVLTVKAAQQFNVPVAGVVLNRYPARPSLAEETNPEVIEAIAEVPVVGRVPDIGDLATPAGKRTFLAAMEKVVQELDRAMGAQAFFKFMISG